MRKIKVMFLLLILVFATSVASAFELNNGWAKFADDQYDLVAVVDGEPIFVRQDNQADFDQVSKAMANELADIKGRHKALPPVKIQLMNRMNGVKEIPSKQVVLPYQVSMSKKGQPEHALYIQEIVHNGKKVLVSEPNSGSVPLIASPQKDKYVFADEHLWIVDANTKKVKQLTNDKSGKHNRLEIITEMEAKNKYFTVHWTHNPRWNTNGSLIAFESNRNNLNTGGMGLWTIDPETSVENHLYNAEHGMQTLGWINASTVLIEELVVSPENQILWDLIVVDVTTGTNSLLVSNSSFLGLNHQFVVYGKITGEPLSEVYAIDVTGNNNQLLATARPGFMYDHMASFSPDGSRVLLKSRNQQGTQVITLVNLHSMVAKDIEGPWGQMIETDPIWLNDSQIMIQTSTEGNHGQVATWTYQL